MACRLGRVAAAVLLVWGGAVAHAVPGSVPAGRVVIDYDTDAFSFSRDTLSFGGVVSEAVDPLSVGIAALSDGIELQFNGLMSVTADSSLFFSEQTLQGAFSAPLTFSTLPGWRIDGYTVTYTGSYQIERPGSVGLTTPGGGSNGVNESNTSGSFSVSGELATTSGSVSIIGAFVATAFIDQIEVVVGTQQVQTGTEQVQIGTQQVLDYCEPDNPDVCYYRDEPIYEERPVYTEVPRYETQSDLGQASFNLEKIGVVAHVVAVPEPAGVLLTLAGLGVLVVSSSRRRS